MLPNHVAIILDGNRRWAKEKGLPTFEGHRRGLDQIIKIGKKARQMGIRVLTYWAFSTENWDRSKQEKEYLWQLFSEAIKKYLKEALKEQIRIVHIGRKDRLPVQLVTQLKDVEERTKTFEKYYLVIAMDYGGQDEIIRAINKMSNNVIRNLSIDQFSQLLDTKNLPYPNPDLIIRPGKEIRLSGFMAWQSAYAELIFVNKHMPDFTADDFENCVKEYMNRQRRFGK